MIPGRYEAHSHSRRWQAVSACCYWSGDLPVAPLLHWKTLPDLSLHDWVCFREQDAAECLPFHCCWQAVYEQVCSLFQPYSLSPGRYYVDQEKRRALRLNCRLPVPSVTKKPTRADQFWCLL